MTASRVLILALVALSMCSVDAMVNKAVGSSAVEKFMTMCVGGQVNGFTYVPTGSGSGVAEAEAGGVGISDVPSGNPKLAECPIVAGTIAVVINGVTGAKLDACTLAKIYDCTITMWDDPAIKALNKGVSGLTGPIVPVARSDSSGSTKLLTGYLNTCAGGFSLGPADKVVTWPACVKSADGTSGVLALASSTAGAITYGSRDGGLAQVALKGKGGGFSDATTLKAPISFTAVVVAKKGVAGMAKFLKTVQSKAVQNCAPSAGFLKLPGKQLKCKIK